MTLGRAYIEHRQAYTPRLWPTAVPAALTAFAVTWALGATLGMLGSLVGVLAGVAFGLIVSRVRWRVWEARHPLQPCGPGCWMLFEVYLESEAQRQREVAIWQ